MLAPEIKLYISLYSNRFPMPGTYDEKTCRLLDDLFCILRNCGYSKEAGVYELWLEAERGTLQDFKDYYAGYYDETVDPQDSDPDLSLEELRDWWEDEFPYETVWYRLKAIEDECCEYRALYLENRKVIEQNRFTDPTGKTEFDLSGLVEWLIQAVNKAGKIGRPSIEAERGLYERAKAMPPSTAMKLAQEAESEEERKFFTYISDMNLQWV